MKPLCYRVLLTDQLSFADKQLIVAKVSAMCSGPEADMGSFQRTKDHRWINEHWQYEVVDDFGRVTVLKYRGVEVALFVKRQVAEIELSAGDPAPERALEDPLDVWMRLDLIGPSARQAMNPIVRQNRELSERLMLVRRELSLKEQLVQAVEGANTELRNKLAGVDAELFKLRDAARKETHQSR
jgi:hypothetical protein